MKRKIKAKIKRKENLIVAIYFLIVLTFSLVYYFPIRGFKFSFPTESFKIVDNRSVDIKIEGLLNGEILVVNYRHGTIFKPVEENISAYIAKFSDSSKAKKLFDHSMDVLRNSTYIDYQGNLTIKGLNGYVFYERPPLFEGYLILVQKNNFILQATGEHEESAKKAIEWLIEKIS